jgi:hypothetical protein
VSGLHDDLERFNAAFGVRGYLLSSPDDEAEELLAHAREAADIDRAVYRHAVFCDMLRHGIPRAEAYERASERGHPAHPGLTLRRYGLERIAYGPGRYVHYSVDSQTWGALARRLQG